MTALQLYATTAAWGFEYCDEGIPVDRDPRATTAAWGFEYCDSREEGL